MAQRGFYVIQEAARAYIDGQLASGRTLKEIKADIVSFERHILYEKVHTENRLLKSRTVFLDRAVPDSIAYYQIEGLDTREPLSHCRKVRYKKIFLFDRLNFERDAVRSENQALATKIEKTLEKSYRDLGYSVIRIPVVPITQRIELVLKHASI